MRVWQLVCRRSLSISTVTHSEPCVRSRRTTRRVSFEAGTPSFSRFTFGSLQVAGTPADVVHYVKRRRSSAVGITD